MTLDEALDGLPITAKEAKREVEEHHLLWTDFIEDYGDFAMYMSTDVLHWLGY